MLPQIYMPLGYALGGDSACRGCQHLQVIARLKPGVSIAQAQSDLSAVMRGIVQENPTSYGAGAGVLGNAIVHEESVLAGVFVIGTQHAHGTKALLLEEELGRQVRFAHFEGDARPAMAR